jgi:hypothetical protein
MQQDIAALSDELLAQTLPADKREPGNKPAPAPVEPEEKEDKGKGEGEKEKKV